MTKQMSRFTKVGAGGLALVAMLAVATALNSQLTVEQGLVVEEPSSSIGLVRIGQSGPTPQDMVLRVYDAHFAAAPDEAGVILDAVSGLLNLGSGNVLFPGAAGIVFLEDGLGNVRTGIFGGNGNFFNPLGGNGLAKAWARVNSDGTIIDCYLCTDASVDTCPSDNGIFEVDFFPLGSDIQGRPRLATLDQHNLAEGFGFVRLGNNGDFAPLSTVIVVTANAAGSAQGRSFNLVIF